MTKDLIQIGLNLVRDGASIEEALSAVLKEAAQGKSRVIAPEDRPEWIMTLDDLQELRAAIKCAYAKKSKAKKANNEVAFERACAEVKNGQARLNEIIMKIDVADNPLVEARKYNESVSNLTQRFLSEYSEILDDRKALIENKTKKEIKLGILAMDLTIPENLDDILGNAGGDIRAEFNRRLEKDIWVQTVVKETNYLNSL